MFYLQSFTSGADRSHCSHPFTGWTSLVTLSKQFPFTLTMKLSNFYLFIIVLAEKY